MLSLKIYNFCFKHAKLQHFQIRKQLEHLDNHGEDIYIGNFEATRARGSWLDLYKTFLYTLSFFSYWHQCFNILLINTFFGTFQHWSNLKFLLVSASFHFQAERQLCLPIPIYLHLHPTVKTAPIYMATAHIQVDSYCN